MTRSLIRPPNLRDLLLARSGLPLRVVAATVVVRSASPDDFAAVGELTVAAYGAAGLLDNDEQYIDELRDAAHRAAADRTDLLVAVDRDGGRIVGSVTFVLPGSPFAELSGPAEAEFRHLAVDPEGRGRGVGELLVRACIDRARQHGCEGMVLSTAPISHDAHRLYARLGFRRAPERDWWPAPDFPLLAYELPLPPR